MIIECVFNLFSLIRTKWRLGIFFNFLLFLTFLPIFFRVRGTRSAVIIILLNRTTFSAFFKYTLFFPTFIQNFLKKRSLSPDRFLLLLCQCFSLQQLIEISFPINHGGLNHEFGVRWYFILFLRNHNPSIPIYQKVHTIPTLSLSHYIILRQC